MTTEQAEELINTHQKAINSLLSEIARLAEENKVQCKFMLPDSNMGLVYRHKIVDHYGGEEFSMYGDFVPCDAQFWVSSSFDC